MGGGTGPRERRAAGRKCFKWRPILFYMLLNLLDHSELSMYYSVLSRLKRRPRGRRPAAYSPLFFLGTFCLLRHVTSLKEDEVLFSLTGDHMKYCFC